MIRRTIAPVLRECPSACGVISLTEVEVSSDFSHATIYVSALAESDLAVQFLEERRSELQRALGQLCRKRIPLLRFRKDLRSEQGKRIDELLG